MTPDFIPNLPNPSVAPFYDNNMITNSNVGDFRTAAVAVSEANVNPLGAEDVALINSKYTLDIRNVVTTKHKEQFPMLFTFDLGAKSANLGDSHMIGEDNSQDMQMYDYMQHKLRLASLGTGGVPYAIDDPLNIGGMLKFRALGSGMLAKFATAYDGTAVNDLLNGTTVTTTHAPTVTLADVTLNGAAKHHILPIAWGLGGAGETMSNGGSDAIRTISKLIGVFKAEKYKELGVTNAITEATSNTPWFGYSHIAGADGEIRTVHALFEDLAVKIDSTVYQLNEVVVRIAGFFYRSDYKQFVLLLDFDYSNIEEPLSGTAASNTFLLEEIAKDADSSFAGTFTRLSDRFLLGMHTSVPTAIAQGSDFAMEGVNGFMYEVSYSQNFSQIVTSDPVVQTGTLLKTVGSLRVNQPAKLREKALLDFKKKRRNLQLWGKGASRKVNAQGKIEQTSAGFFNYQMFPIRYSKMKLNRYSAADKLEAGRAFVKNYARSVFAFNPTAQDTGVIEVMCSRYFADLLDDMLKLGLQTANNVAGYTTGGQPLPAGQTMNLKRSFTDIATTYGTLRFKVDASLDYVPDMMLPAFLGTDYNPKTMLVAINPGNVSTVVTRAPELKGNIQGNNADYVAEIMYSEETTEVRDCMSHMVTLVDVQ